MPALSQQEVSDLCSALFRVDTKAGQQRGVKRTLQQTGGAALLGGNVAFNPTAPEQAEVLRSLATFAQMDDVAFQAVFFNHPLLPKMMRWLVLEAAGVSAHAAANQQQQQQQGEDNDEASSTMPTSKENIAHLRLVIARCLCWQPSSSSAASGDPSGVQRDPAVLCERLESVFPADIITAVALVLAKSAPLLGSVAITCWALQCPTAVATLSSFGGMWNSRVQELNATCNALARRGRFERNSRDVLSILQNARALVLGVWSLTHSCPFLVDALSGLPRLVTSARVIAEEISPALQHFVFTCDRLAPARPKLVRVIQKIANAAVDLASTAMIFSSHWSSANNSTFKEYIRTYDRAISEQIRDRGGFVARMLLKGTTTREISSQSTPTGGSVGSVREALNHMLPGTSLAVPDDAERLRGLREALPQLEEGGGSATKHSTSAVKMHAAFFAEQVLRRIAQQKVRLNPDDAPNLVLPKGANNPNGSATVSSSSSSSSPSSPAAPAAGAASKNNNNNNNNNNNETKQILAAVASAECKYPDLIPLVMEFLPQLGSVVVAKALNYYSGNMERLIEDAMAGNLPPHIADGSAASASASASDDQQRKRRDEESAAAAAAVNNNSSRVPSLIAGASPSAAASHIYDQQKQGLQADGAKDANETLLHLLVGDFDATSSVPDDDDDDDGRRFDDDADDDDDGSTRSRRDDDEAYRRYGGGEGVDPSLGTRLERRSGGMGKARATSDDWSALMPMEQDLVEKTRLLMERMYTDELDDAAGIGNDGVPDVRPLNRKGMAALSDDDNDDEGAEGEGGGGRGGEDGGDSATAASSSSSPFFAAGGGSFFSGQMNRRKPQDASGAAADEDAAKRPAYTRKPKTDWRKNETKRHEQNSSGPQTKQNVSGRQNTKQLMKQAQSRN